MAARTWIVVVTVTAAAAGAGIVLARRARVSQHAPPAPATAVPAAPAAPPLPSAPPPAGAGLEVVVQDDATSAPTAAELTATDDAGHHVVGAVGADGRGRLAIAPGRWSVTARTPSGATLAVTRADRWELGAQPPPWLEVRVAAPVAAAPAPAPPPGTARLIGIATLDGARPADVIVAPVWLGGFGPGHAVTLDKVPQPIALPPRRFVGTGGVWRMDDVPEGGYALVVIVPWRGAALVRTTATAAMAGDGSATLTAPVQLSGTVLDQHGREIAGATVRVTVSGFELGHVTTDARGTFRLFDLPAGALVVDGRAAGCVGERKDVSLAPGADAHVTLAIVCDHPAATL